MARLFSVTNDRIERTTGQQIASTGTISLWLKPNFTSGDSTTRNMYGFGGGGGQNLPSFQRFADNNIYCGFYDGAEKRVIIADTGLFTSGVWANWAFTWDISSSSAVYKDGVSKGSNSISVSGGSLSAGYFIGAGEPCGTLADAAVWNVRLTAHELLGLARGMRPSRIRRGSLVMWLPLFGISPEPDLSGSVFNGTVVGSTSAFGPPFDPITPRWHQVLEQGAAGATILMPQACL